MTVQQEKDFEAWFNQKEETCEIYGNGDDFCIEDEIKRFCKMAFKAGVNSVKAEIEKIGLCLQSDMDKTIEQNMTLKRVFEKMKTCYNCKYYDTDVYERKICKLDTQNQWVKSCANMNKWELKD